MSTGKEKNPGKNSRHLVLENFFPRLGGVDENLKKLAERAEAAVEAGAELICFPELATSGYLLENLAWSSALRADDQRFHPLLELSREIMILLGLILEEGGNYFNAMIVMHGGRVLGVQKKIYPPTYGMFDESRYYRAGESLFVFDSPFGRSGILICEDAWHPVLAYSLAVRNVRHVFIPSASPARGFESAERGWFASQLNWAKRLQVYCESFGQFYYYVNRSGSEDGVNFGGDRFVITPLQLELRNDADNFFTIDTDDLKISRSQGGPFQEEKWTLNRRLLSEAYRARHAE